MATIKDFPMKYFFYYKNTLRKMTQGRGLFRELVKKKLAKLTGACGGQVFGEAPPPYAKKKSVFSQIINQKCLQYIFFA